MSAELLPCQSDRSVAHTRHGHASREVHGKKNSPTYNSWLSMKDRCIRKRHHSSGYENVTVCDRWLSFDSFLADMGERPNGATLDRVDSSGNYEPSNCRWATPREQARNTRHNVLTIESATLVAVDRLKGTSCREIASKYGISESLPREIVKGRCWPDALEAARKIMEGDNA